MRLHAFFAQALPPAPAPRHQLAQLPGIKLSEAAANDDNYTAFAQTLEEQADGRVEDVRKALGQWGRVEIVDVSFRGAFARVSGFHGSPDSLNSDRGTPDYTFIDCLPCSKTTGRIAGCRADKRGGGSGWR